jgi:phosphoribosylaminoimidazole-succinocarboxamide synthase
MITDRRIREELHRTLHRTDFPELGPKEQGKVRDGYCRADRRILITTDRISAFDRVLGTIPFKGQVLNQLAAFWFEKTADVAPNHILDVPDPNVMVVRECRQLPLEFVVRGYITGVTKTSAWYNYQQGVRRFCGNALPEGLRKDQRLEKPILTPTTKLEKHDRSISREEAIGEGLISAEMFDAVAALAFALYEAGVRHARTRGLILVDTKYEFGLADGRVLVSDEIHTPDSSRYWYADTYEERFRQGLEQKNIDKEFVREWLAARGFRGDGEPPALTDEIRMEAARRYIRVYELITGREFAVSDEPLEARIRRALRAGGYL